MPLFPFLYLLFVLSSLTHPHCLQFKQTKDFALNSSCRLILWTLTEVNLCVTEPGRSNEKWVDQQESVVSMLGKYHKPLILKDWPRTNYLLQNKDLVGFLEFLLLQPVLVCFLQHWLQKEEAGKSISSKALCPVNVWMGRRHMGWGWLIGLILQLLRTKPRY